MAAGSDAEDAEWAGPIERDVRSLAGWDGEAEGEGTPLEDEDEEADGDQIPLTLEALYRDGDVDPERPTTPAPTTAPGVPTWTTTPRRAGVLPASAGPGGHGRRETRARQRVPGRRRMARRGGGRWTPGARRVPAVRAVGHAE